MYSNCSFNVRLGFWKIWRKEEKKRRLRHFLFVPIEWINMFAMSIETLSEEISGVYRFGIMPTHNSSLNI